MRHIEFVIDEVYDGKKVVAYLRGQAKLSARLVNSLKRTEKGFKNYWLYQMINKQTPLGILYSLNYVFLISTAIFTVLAITIGFIKMFRPIVFVCSILLCLIEIH